MISKLKSVYKLNTYLPCNITQSQFLANRTRMSLKEPLLYLPHPEQARKEVWASATMKANVINSVTSSLYCTAAITKLGPRSPNHIRKLASTSLIMMLKSLTVQELMSLSQNLTSCPIRTLSPASECKWQQGTVTSTTTQVPMNSPQ